MKAAVYMLLIVCGLSNNGLAQGFITLKGRVFHDEQDNRFFPLVMNYGAMIYTNQADPGVLKLGRDRAYGTIGCPNYEGGYTWADLEMSLVDDFHQIKSMGFNAIRLNMQPTFEPIDSNSLFYETFDFPRVCDSALHQVVRFPASCTNNINAIKYFELVEKAIQFAADEGLKVILLCIGNRPLRNLTTAPQFGSNDQYSTDYATYLEVLANRLKTKTNLISYELFPEPHWAVGDRELVKSKSEICRYVNQWVAAIKNADQVHLIDMEGTNHNDVYDWDGAIMNVDFIAMHPYPFLLSSEISDRARIGSDRVIDQIAFIANNLNKPFIIGETGFSAPPLVDQCLVPPYVDGTEDDEKLYVEKILNASRDLGASGFSYWDFMDKHWFSVPDFLCSDCYYCNGVHTPTPAAPAAEYWELRENYYGLMRYSNPVVGLSHPWLYDPADESKAVEVFRLFEPFIFKDHSPETEYFHNPYQFSANYSEIFGAVSKYNGEPFGDILVTYPTNADYITPDNRVLETTYDNYDISDKNTGAYAIKYSSNTRRSLEVLVGGFGTNVVKSSVSNSVADPAYLQQAYWNSQSLISGLTIGIEVGYRGHSEYEFYNVQFVSGADVEVVARDFVKLGSDVNLERGAEVDLRTEDVAQDCNYYSGFSVGRLGSIHIPASASAKMEIDVRYHSLFPEMVLYPNPAKYSIRIRKSTHDERDSAFRQYNIIVSNMFGGLVMNKSGYSLGDEIFIGEFSPGIYFLFMESGGEKILHKLTIIR